MPLARGPCPGWTEWGRERSNTLDTKMRRDGYPSLVSSVGGRPPLLCCSAVPGKRLAGGLLAIVSRRLLVGTLRQEGKSGCQLWRF